MVDKVLSHGAIRSQVNDLVKRQMESSASAVLL